MLIAKQQNKNTLTCRLRRGHEGTTEGEGDLPSHLTQHELSLLPELNHETQTPASGYVTVLLCFLTMSFVSALVILA